MLTLLLLFTQHPAINIFKNEFTTINAVSCRPDTNLTLNDLMKIDYPHHFLYVSISYNLSTGHRQACFIVKYIKIL